MTFKDMAFQDNLKMMAVRNRYTEPSFIRSLMDNQSPVMKFWFAIMAINLLMFLFILN